MAWAQNKSAAAAIRSSSPVQPALSPRRSLPQEAEGDAAARVLRKGSSFRDHSCLERKPCLSVQPPPLGTALAFLGWGDEDTKAASVCRSQLSPLRVVFFPLFSLPSPLPQAKLEEALALATDFQNSLQDFINWLTLAEQSLNIAPPPSLILAAVLAQIDEHKVPQELHP